MIRRCSWRPWTKNGIRTVFDRQERRVVRSLKLAWRTFRSIVVVRSIDTKGKEKERRKRYGRREEEKKQLNTHTCCIYGLHERKRIYRVGTEREWVTRYVWGYRWRILLDGRFKTTKLIVGRKIFDLYKCSSVYIFIIKKKKRTKKTMLGYEKENGKQWERKTSIVLQCLLLWRIIREREDEYSVRVYVCVGEYNGEIWSYEWARWENWKRSIKRSIVRCNKLLEKRYNNYWKETNCKQFLSAYIHIYRLTYMCIYTRLEEKENRRDYRYCYSVTSN